MKSTVKYLATAVVATTFSGAAFTGGDYDKSRQDHTSTSSQFEATENDGLVTAGDHEGEPRGHRPGFSQLDTDQDGMVSQDEYRSAASSDAADNLDEKWSELDTNQDGELDRAEFARFESVDENSGADPTDLKTTTQPEHGAMDSEPHDY